MKNVATHLGCLAVVLSLNACGVADADIDGALTDESGDALSNPAIISASDAVFNGTTTVKFKPGRYADSGLTVGFKCTQNGAVVLAAGSFSLKYALSINAPGYSYADGVYTIVYSGLSSPSYTGGEADCVVSGYTWSQHGTSREIAKGTFHIAAQ